jgi:hypothetical protein
MSDRVEKRRAYEAANASHRRYEARFAAPSVLGATAAEVFDEAARLELERLAAAKAEAYDAWQASLRS